MTSNASSGVLPDLYEASIAELQDGLVQGLFSSVQLVKVSYFMGTYLIQALLLSDGRPTLAELKKLTSKVLNYAQS
jgi:hypothetical protein